MFKKLRNILYIMIILLLLFSTKIDAHNRNIYENEDTTRIELEFYEAVDGDTAKFNLNNEIITVRFLGIDTPETVHTQKEEQPYGQEASNYTKTRLENGDKIELEYDSNSSEKDKYGRALAWIWIDDSLLQEELVKNGLARTYMLQNNYRYAGRLQLAEEEAKNNHINFITKPNESIPVEKKK